MIYHWQVGGWVCYVLVVIADGKVFFSTFVCVLCVLKHVFKIRFLRLLGRWRSGSGARRVRHRLGVHPVRAVEAVVKAACFGC